MSRGNLVRGGSRQSYTTEIVQFVTYSRRSFNLGMGRVLEHVLGMGRELEYSGVRSGRIMRLRDIIYGYVMAYLMDRFQPVGTVWH